MLESARTHFTLHVPLRSTHYIIQSDALRCYFRSKNCGVFSRYLLSMLSMVRDTGIVSEYVVHFTQIIRDFILALFTGDRS